MISPTQETTQHHSLTLDYNNDDSAISTGPFIIDDIYVFDNEIGTELFEQITQKEEYDDDPEFPVLQIDHVYMDNCCTMVELIHPTVLHHHLTQLTDNLYATSEDMFDCLSICQQSDPPSVDITLHHTFNAIMTNVNYLNKHTILSTTPTIHFYNDKIGGKWIVTITANIHGNVKQFQGQHERRSNARTRAIAALLNSVLIKDGCPNISQLYLFSAFGNEVSTEKLIQCANLIRSLKSQPIIFDKPTQWQLFGLVALVINTDHIDDLTTTNVIMRFYEHSPVTFTFSGTKEQVLLQVSNAIIENVHASNPIHFFKFLKEHDFIPVTVHQQADVESAFEDVSTIVNEVTIGTGVQLEVTDPAMQKVPITYLPANITSLVSTDETVTLPYATEHTLPIATVVVNEASTQTVTPFLMLDVLQSILSLEDNIQTTMFTRTLLSRPKLNIIIKINATYTYQGRFVAELIPQLGQILQMPGGEIDYVASRITVDDMIKRKATQFDASASTDIMLSMDFLDVINALNNRDTNHMNGYATLLIGSVTPLRTGPQEIAQLTLNVYAHLEGTEFMQRTYPISDTSFLKQTNIVIRQQMMSMAGNLLGGKFIEKSADNLLSPLIHNTGKWLGRLIPAAPSERRPNVKAYDRDATGDYAKDRPEHFVEPTHFKPMYTDNLAIGMGHEPMTSMRLNPSAEQQIAPCQTPVILDMVEIAQAPSRFNLFQMTPQNVAYQLLFEQVIDYRNFHGTNMMYAMEMFHMIRSSVDVKLNYVKPMGTQGSIMLAFVPNQTTATYVQARNCKTHTVDLNAADETEFNVPYWGSTTARRFDNDTMLGVFQVYAIVPMTAPSITSQIIDVVVYIGAGEDCEMTGLTSQAFAYNSYAQQSGMTSYLLNETQSNIASIVSRYNLAYISSDLTTPVDFIVTPTTLTGQEYTPKSFGALGKILNLFKYVNSSFDILIEIFPTISADAQMRNFSPELPIAIIPPPAPPNAYTSASFTKNLITVPPVTATTTLSNAYTSFSNDSAPLLAGNLGGLPVRHEPYNVPDTVLNLDVNRNGRTCTANNTAVKAILDQNNSTSSVTQSALTSVNLNIDRIKTALDTNLALNPSLVGQFNTDTAQNSALSRIVTGFNDNVTIANGNNVLVQSQIATLSGQVAAGSGNNAIFDITYSPPTTNISAFQGAASQKINTAINPSLNMFIPKSNVYALVPTYVTQPVARLLEAERMGTLRIDNSVPYSYRISARLADSKQLVFFLGAPSVSPPTDTIVKQQADFNSDSPGPSSIIHENPIVANTIAQNDNINVTTKKSIFKKITNKINPIHKLNKTIGSTADAVNPAVGRLVDIADNVGADVAKVADATTNMTHSITKLVEEVRGTLIDAAERVKSLFNQVLSVDKIISVIISIVLGIMNPTPLSLALCLFNSLLSIGIISWNATQELMKYLTKKFETHSETETSNSDVTIRQQCDHECVSCYEMTTCDTMCKFCENVRKSDETNRLFNAADQTFLTGTIISGIMAVIGFKGKPPTMNIKTKLFETASGFYRSLPGIMTFVSSFMNFIKKIAKVLFNSTPQSEALKILSDKKELFLFHKKIALFTTPSFEQSYTRKHKGRMDFLSTYIKAKEYQMKLSHAQNPALNAINVDLRKFIDYATPLIKRLIAPDYAVAPLAFMMFGATGVGKSYQMPLLAKELLLRARNDNLIIRQPSVFSLTDEVPYMTMYKDDPAMIIDELFPTVTAESLAERVRLVFAVVSDNKVNVPKADIPSKDEVLDLDLLLTGTNSPFLEQIQAVEPVAFHRRFTKIAVRLKVPERLKQLKKPATVTECIKGTYDHRTINERIVSYKEYLAEEMDDMYEYLFFNKNLTDNVTLSHGDYEKIDGMPAWLSTKEFKERAYGMFKEHLIHGDAKRQVHYNQLKEIHQMTPQQLKEVDALARKIIVDDQVAKLTQLTLDLDKLEPEVVQQSSSPMEKLFEDPIAFTKYVEESIASKIGKCHYCCVDNDETYKTLVFYCSNYQITQEYNVFQTPTFSANSCKRGLCKTHAKVYSAASIVNAFATNVICDCDHPQVHCMMSDISVYRRIAASLKIFVKKLNANALAFLYSQSLSPLFLMTSLLIGGVPTYQRFVTTNRITATIHPEPAREYVEINKEPFVALQHRGLAHCTHSLSMFSNPEDKCSRFVRNPDPLKSVYIIGDTDGIESEVDYYPCNETCVMTIIEQKALFKLWESCNPSWDENLPDKEQLDEIPIHCLIKPKIAGKEPLYLKPNIKWYHSLKNAVSKNLFKIFGVIGLLISAIGLLKGMTTLANLFLKRKPKQQAYVTKGAKSPRPGPTPRALKNLIHQQNDQSEIITSLITANIVEFHVNAVSVKGLCLRGRTILMPTHSYRFLERAHDAQEQITSPYKGTFKPLKSMTVFQPPQFQKNKWELVLLHCADLPQRPDVTAHIMAQNAHTHVPLMSALVYIDKNSHVIHKDTNILAYDTTVITSTGHFVPEHISNYYVTTTSIEGACGGFYIQRAAHTKKPAAFAMHIAGSSDGKGYAIPLIQQLLIAVCNDMDMQMKQIHQQSDVNDQLDVVEILTKGVFVPDKTKLRPSLISTQLTNQGYICQGTPSILSARDPRFNAEEQGVTSPLLRGVLEHGTNPAFDFDQGLVNYAIESIAKHYITQCPPFSLQHSMFTAEEAIRGVRCCDDVILKGMDMNTSVGIGGSYRQEMKTQKHYYLSVDDDDQLVMDPEMHAELMEQYEFRSTGEKYGSIFMDQLKDERRTKKTTRMFSGSECVLTILTRMTKGAFIAATTKHHMKIRTAIGMDTQSNEWHEMAMDLLQHPNYLAGDFKAFGPRIPRNIVEASGRVAELWYEFYFPNRDIVETNIMKSCHAEICPSYHVASKMVYQAPSGIPSGHPTTTLDNTTSHDLMDLVIYLEIMMANKETQKYATFESYLQNVHMWDLGDDEVKSISDIIAPYYHGISMSQAYDRYNIVFTDAQKKGTVKFNTWEELEFLKSKFVLHPTTGNWIPQMRMTTIIDTAHWIHKTTNEMEMTVQNAEQSLALAWGWGPTKHTELRKVYQAILRNLGEMRNLRTWEELNYLILNRSHGLVDGTFAPLTDQVHCDMIEYTLDS